MRNDDAISRLRAYSTVAARKQSDSEMSSRSIVHSRTVYSNTDWSVVQFLLHWSEIVEPEVRGLRVGILAA